MPALRRRHPEIVFLSSDSREDFTLIGLARNEVAYALGSPEQTLACVQPQVRLALVGVGPMALVAVLGEDRADVAVETNLLTRDGAGGRPEGQDANYHQVQSPQSRPTHRWLQRGWDRSPRHL